MDVKQLKEDYSKAKTEKFNGIEVVSANKEHLNFLFKQAEMVEVYQKSYNRVIKVLTDYEKHYKELSDFSLKNKNESRSEHASGVAYGLKVAREEMEMIFENKLKRFKSSITK